jgi:hypothetical protein
LPSPNSRNEFIWCFNGVGTVGVCDDGLEFEPFDRICTESRWGPTRSTRNPIQGDQCAGRQDNVSDTFIYSK